MNSLYNILLCVLLTAPISSFLVVNPPTTKTTVQQKQFQCYRHHQPHIRGRGSTWFELKLIQRRSFDLQRQQLPIIQPTKQSARRKSYYTIRNKCCHHHSTRTVLFLSSSPSGDNYNDEETLLYVRLHVREGVVTDDAIQSVSKFCQSYPFSAVLPVQPLTYLPITPSNDGKSTKDIGGVEIQFLRKKTPEKSSIDGGIRFFVSAIPTTTTTATTDKNDNNNADDNDDDDEDDVIVPTTDTIEIIAKRNSKGQSISKIFAEKLIITSFVSSLTGGVTTESGATTPSSRAVFGNPPIDFVTVQSIFHKWMD